MGYDRKSLLAKNKEYEWDLNSSCIEEGKCEHVKSLLPQDLLAACSWHFILSEAHSLLNLGKAFGMQE